MSQRYQNDSKNPRPGKLFIGERPYEPLFAPIRATTANGLQTTQAAPSHTPDDGHNNERSNPSLPAVSTTGKRSVPVLLFSETHDTTPCRIPKNRRIRRTKEGVPTSRGHPLANAARPAARLLSESEPPTGEQERHPTSFYRFRRIVSCNLSKYGRIFFHVFLLSEKPSSTPLSDEKIRSTNGSGARYISTHRS